MTLDELEALADAAEVEGLRIEKHLGNNGTASANYVARVKTKDLKRLIALCRMQHAVLIDDRYVSRYSHVVEAIAAFEEFQNV